MCGSRLQGPHRFFRVASYATAQEVCSWGNHDPEESRRSAQRWRSSPRWRRGPRQGRRRSKKSADRSPGSTAVARRSPSSSAPLALAETRRHVFAARDLAYDLEAVDILADGRVVALSERLHALVGYGHTRMLAPNRTYVDSGRPTSYGIVWRTPANGVSSSC